MNTRIIGRYWVQNGSKEYLYMRGFLEGAPITLTKIRKFNGRWRILHGDSATWEKIEYRALAAAQQVVAEKYARKK